MTTGERVTYTRPHWAWMVQAGRAEPRHDRRSFTGTLLEVDGEYAVVGWDSGKAWPFVSKVETPLTPTTHLTDNLEVIDA